MFSKSNKAQVWSCGGGTQSCAIGALIVQGKLPKPDVAVIADTGYETQATWDYLEGTLQPALRLVGVEIERIVATNWNRKRATMWCHYDDADRIPDVRIPVYSTRFADRSKLSNQCTGRWKVEPLDRYTSWLGVKRSHQIKWIGFSTDEQRRWARMMGTAEYKKGLIRFPLLEIGLTRRDCIALVESMGWPTPPRSSCYMCPNHSDNEWRKLKSERPDEFEKAVQLEREIHQRDPDAWLHRSCVPLDQVDFSQPEDLFSRPCDSGLCFV